MKQILTVGNTTPEMYRRERINSGGLRPTLPHKRASPSLKSREENALKEYGLGEVEKWSKHFTDRTKVTTSSSVKYIKRNTSTTSFQAHVASMEEE